MIAWSAAPQCTEVPKPPTVLPGSQTTLGKEVPGKEVYKQPGMGMPTSLPIRGTGSVSWEYAPLHTMGHGAGGTWLGLLLYAPNTVITQLAQHPGLWEGNGGGRYGLLAHGNWIPASAHLSVHG